MAFQPSSDACDIRVARRSRAQTPVSEATRSSRSEPRLEHGTAAQRDIRNGDLNELADTAGVQIA